MSVFLYAQRHLFKCEITTIIVGNFETIVKLYMYQKVFEGIIYKQINKINIYMQDKLSKHVTGFRKSHGTRYSLITMLEKWKSVLGKGENIGVLFTDLSKAFNTINHDLLLAKLKAYGFSINAVDLMCSYLKNQRQSVQINNDFSSAIKAPAGVPQGTTNGPLLFNLFVNDSVLFLTDTLLSNYDDDNSLYGTLINECIQLLVNNYSSNNIIDFLRRTSYNLA